MGTGSVASLVLQCFGPSADGACPLFRTAHSCAVKKGDRHLAAMIFARIRPVACSEPVPLFHSRFHFEDREKRGQAPRGHDFRENSARCVLGASPHFSLSFSL